MADIPCIPTLFDANGQQINSAYAPVTSRPGQALYSSQGGILSLGVDSSGNARSPRVDANGNQYTVPATAVQAGTALASSSSVVGNVLLALQSLTPTAAQMDGLGNINTAPAQSATFSAYASAVALSAGKSLLCLSNKTTSSVLRLIAVYAQDSAVNPSTLTTYYVYAEQLHFFTSCTGGTSVTPVAFDTADSLASGVTIMTGATVSGEVSPAIRRWLTSTYPVQAGGTTSENVTFDEQGRAPWFNGYAPGSKPIVIRPGYGVHLKSATTSTNGAQDVTFVFTQSAA